MPLARKHLVDDSRPGCFHLISRCVRRAYLCGDDAEPRRAWVRELIREAAGAFAVDVLAYAVMSNHLHLVVASAPDRVTTWTAREVAQRWASAHPRLGADGAAVAWSEAEITARAADGAWVATARLRLRSVSWFMKCIKERLARRANRADGCTGHFWEGRFQSVALLDQAAVLACMAYVDLNPIRAGMADRPETSAFTSVHDRIHTRQAARRQARRAARAATAATDGARITTHTDAAEVDAEAGLWIAPIARATVDPRSMPIVDVAGYLTLVDETGRIVRSGKRGAIPAHLAPILDRLHLDLDAWLGLMQRGGAFRGGAFGRMAARAAEALRRGTRWVVDITCGLYRDEQRQPASA